MTFPTVYSFDFSGSKVDLDDIRQLLGQERYEYCKKMKNVKAAGCSAYVFLLLRYALKKEFGITEIPRFEYNEHGKPFLKDFPSVFFNMSHAGTRCVCAVSGSPVGIDVQDIRKLDLKTAGKFLTKNELAGVSEISDKAMLNEELCRLWCIKESYGKYTGKGFTEGFTGFEAEQLVKAGKVICTHRDDYFLSLCI